MFGTIVLFAFGTLVCLIGLYVSRWLEMLVGIFLNLIFMAILMYQEKKKKKSNNLKTENKEQSFFQYGHAYVKSKIDAAVRDGSRIAVVSGKLEIDKPIRLPSNFSLILENCHLRMADGCYSNMFVNEHHDTELGKTQDGTDKNIRILGRGRAIIDGGKYNGLSEKNHSRNGMPPIWKNNLILFTNVDGFKISNISCRNQRWWAMNFIYCSNGYIGGIDFCSNDILIDPNGNEIHGLRRADNYDVLVKNADGIDLRCGCHDIVIKNLTGFTEDDTVALTALDGNLEKTFAVKGLPSDIYNVKIKNISTASFCTNVRLLNQGDFKLHDIVIDGVYDQSEGSPHMDKGLYAVRVGDTRLYGTRHSTKEETYNIRIKNVVGGGLYAVSLAGEVGNLVMSDIRTLGDTQMILDQRTD